MRTKLIVAAGAVTAVLVLLVASAPAITAHTAIHAKRAHGATETWTFSAFTQAATVMRGIPPGVHAPSPAQRPTAGTVHELGNGGAFGWVKNGGLCWNAGQPFGVAACGGSGARQAIDLAIYPIMDPWPLDATRPAHVLGIAADGISEVVVTLDDGSTFSAPVVKNFYDVQLPATVPPWRVAEVTAVSAAGATAYARAVRIRPPSQLNRSTVP